MFVGLHKWMIFSSRYFQQGPPFKRSYLRHPLDPQTQIQLPVDLTARRHLKICIAKLLISTTTSASYESPCLSGKGLDFTVQHFLFIGQRCCSLTMQPVRQASHLPRSVSVKNLILSFLCRGLRIRPLDGPSVVQDARQHQTIDQVGVQSMPYSTADCACVRTSRSTNCFPSSINQFRRRALPLPGSRAPRAILTRAPVALPFVGFRSRLNLVTTVEQASPTEALRDNNPRVIAASEVHARETSIFEVRHITRLWDIPSSLKISLSRTCSLVKSVIKSAEHLFD